MCFLKFHPRSQPSDTTTKCSPSISLRCLYLSISFASYPTRFRTRSPCVPFSFPSLLYNRDIHFSFCFIAYYYYYHSSFSISRLLFLSGFEDLHYFIHLAQTMWTMLTGQNKWYSRKWEMKEWVAINRVNEMGDRQVEKGNGSQWRYTGRRNVNRTQRTQNQL